MAVARDRGTAARLALLREVLELTVAVVRRDLEDDPASVPAALRNVAHMARLGSRALRVVDRAGDDERLRARVAEVVDDGGLGPAGILWLERPEGWERDLDRLVAEQVAAEEEAAAARASERERRARGKAEQARDRAREEAARLRTQLDEVRARLAEARAAEAASEARASEVEQARRQAVRELGALKAVHARAHADLRALREELAAVRRGPAPCGEGSGAATPAERDPGDAVAAAPAVDPELGAAVARATELVTSLGEALGDLAARVAPAPDGPPPAPDRRPPPPPPRRRPARLPGGVHDDSPEAADHLVRRAGAVLLVDGYNVALATWPDLPLPEQRERLVAALDALEARTGVDARVVFDGVAERDVGPSRARRVGVRFTPEGVEADDDILATVDALPPEVTVLVASDDGRVREGARAGGANVLTVDQLRSAMG